MNQDELSKCSYKELQSEAHKLGLPGNMKKKQLMQLLKAALDGNVEEKKRLLAEEKVRKREKNKLKKLGSTSTPNHRPNYENYFQSWQMIAKQEKRCREAADPSAGYDQFKTGMLVRRLMSDCQNYSNQQSSMLERALYRMSGGEMNPQGGGGPCPGPSSEPRVVTVMEPTANLPQDAVDYSNYQLLDSTGFKHKQPLLQRMLQAPIGANLGEIASPEAGPYPPPTATYCDLNGDLDNSDTLTANSDDVNDPDDPEDYSRQYSSCNNAMFEENNSNNNNNHQARSYLMMGNQCTFDNNSRGKWIQDPEYVIADTTSGDACMAAPCQQSAETSSRCLPINYYLQNSQNFNYYYNSVAQQHLINQHQRDFYQGQQQQQQQTLTSQQQNDNSLYFAHNRQIPSDNSYQQLEDQQQQQQQLNEAYNYHRSSSGVNYSQQQQHYSNQAANNLEYSQYSSGSSSQQNDTLNANNDCQMPRHTDVLGPFSPKLQERSCSWPVENLLNLKTNNNSPSSDRSKMEQTSSVYCYSAPVVTDKQVDLHSECTQKRQFYPENRSYNLSSVSLVYDSSARGMQLAANEQQEPSEHCLETLDPIMRRIEGLVDEDKQEDLVAVWLRNYGHSSSHLQQIAAGMSDGQMITGDDDYIDDTTFVHNQLLSLDDPKVRMTLQ